jgi:predicted 3-demethylubiquinone-9 3-methyltransferase (glyoxalase superfamily)
MQKIAPFLWFDHQAEEAAKLYTSLFGRSRVTGTSRYGEAGPGPKGTVMTASFELEGLPFTALNGGPVFSFTPAISFFVTCPTEAEVDALWRELSRGGKVMMELSRYPFSQKFGWLSDRYGLSWQINLSDRPKKITPFFFFVGRQHGKAEEAMKSWVSKFEGSSIAQVERYPAGMPEPEGTVMHGRFALAGQEFMAMESAGKHEFTFTPAISFWVSCENQEEVDRCWDTLSAGGKPGQCGWLEDAYGVSWQVVPAILPKLLGDKDPARAKRVTEAMLKMTRLDIGKLQEAHAR